ncbi:unnamed protein product [Blepharisma stoltei]|uniref:Crossover junction endonuclease MUS81 n=1 Tax=Blepharisma stoltei TaxID=1481888 RepID=A0AAU9J0D7_9CILI|nr:unnamed protein product [Blepharisma stoltei]
MSRSKNLKCNENLYLYEKLDDLRTYLIKRGEERKAMNAKRILSALIKFPLPILSAKIASSLLQGVGPWFEAKFEEWIKEKPIKRKSEEIPSTQVEKVKKYIPEPGSDEWICLLSIYYSEEKKISTYDIGYICDQVLSGYYDIEKPKSPTQAFQTLIENGLVEEDCEVYSLTSIGEILTPKLISQCPRNFKKYLASQEERKEFDPDSWIEDSNDASTEASNSSQNFSNFSIVLLVDTAERLYMDFQAISERLINRNVIVEKSKLWIGDYMWLCKLEQEPGVFIDFSLGIVVERKTADDLASSLVDGRYEAQKIRLKQAGIKCIYLLEGTKPSPGSRISQDTLLNALASTQFNYGFQVKITKDSQDTLNWLARMTAALQVEVSGWSLDKFEKLETFENYFDSTNPNGKLTVYNLFGKQLRALDNCGEQGTLAILKNYKTPYKLYRELKNAASKGKRHLARILKEIKLENGNTLSKTLREQLIQLFLC